MTAKPYSTKNKGKTDKGQTSNPAPKRPTNARELPTQVHNNLFRFFSENSINELLASTKSHFRAFVDYLLDLEQRSSNHYTCCPHFKSNNNEKAKAIIEHIEIRICSTCHKKGKKKAMAKCNRCAEWFHPACENEEPRQWEDDHKFESWNCEDCEAIINARYNEDEDEENDVDNQEYDEEEDEDEDEENDNDLGGDFSLDDDFSE